jgi:type IV pilus assembly protein PilB
VTYTRERLGELLVSAGTIEESMLAEALEVQRSTGGKLGEILVSEFGVTEDSIAAGLADQKGLELVSLVSYAIDREAVSLIPVRVARHEKVVPIGFREGSVVLAMADPLDIEAIDEVALRTGRPVLPVVATDSQITAVIEKYMVSADAFQDVIDTTLPDVEPTDETVVGSEEDVPIVRLVNQLIREAVIDRASDVHVEPGEDSVIVRYRVDGVLKEVMALPKSTRAGITSRIKVMADMDIAERRRPQDGRTAALFDGRQVDLRVASLPTPYGEALTVRILHEALSFKTLEDLGMCPDHLEQMERILTRPFGAILAAGPTGSGKTTSLYAALGRLNEPTRKIITVEDPIEYRMDGVTQMAVRQKIGLTFSLGLRTILRADPDVIMVGEIRDPETAETAIRAALTGHLVLSSIHTNDAPSALTRLVDMHVPPYITSSALVAAVAQRLARRLCRECMEEYQVPAGIFEEAGVKPKKKSGKVTVFRALGCEQCADTGYRGRIGLFEIMELTDDLRRQYLEDAPSEVLRSTALELGMRSLRADAYDKVLSGETSLEEVERVVV